MKKLISRNPVLRFKLGRKIVKALNSWGKDFGTEYIPPVNVTKVPKNLSYYIDQGTANSWYMDNDIVNHDFGPYDSDENLNYPHSGFVADAYSDSYDTLLRALQIATHNIKKASEPFRRRSYNNSVMDPERSYKAENKRYTANNGQRKRAYYLVDPTDGSKYLIGTDGSKTLIKKGSSNTLVLKPRNSQNKISFKDAFNKARQSGLLEFVWNGGRYNTKNKGEEDFIFQNGKWVAPQPAVETPVVPQIQLPTAPSSIYNLINPVEKDLKAPLSVSTVPQIYNRAQVREFLRNKGLNPYSFTGDQRRAVRMVLNGQGTDEDKALVQSMGIFNNNPKVVPLTISELDLNTQKKVMDLTKNMVTDRKWWDASLSPTVDILNLLGQLKLASLSYKQGGMLPSRNIVKRFKQGGILKFLTAGNLPTAPKAEKRYRKSSFNTTKKGNRETTTITSQTFGYNRNWPYFRQPATILRIIEGRDTAFVETPEHHIFTKVLPRTALKSGNTYFEYNPKYDENFSLHGQANTLSNYPVTPLEYEILKGRFNTAYNLAK